MMRKGRVHRWKKAFGIGKFFTGLETGELTPDFGPACLVGGLACVVWPVLLCVHGGEAF